MKYFTHKTSLSLLSMLVNLFVVYLKTFSVLFHDIICDFQVSDLQRELDTLPVQILLAAGFVTYLGSQPEDVRKSCVVQWKTHCNVEHFDFMKVVI